LSTLSNLHLTSPSVLDCDLTSVHLIDTWDAVFFPFSVTDKHRNNRNNIIMSRTHTRFREINGSADRDLVRASFPLTNDFPLLEARKVSAQPGSAVSDWE
jgi:hypothetical protein